MSYRVSDAQALRTILGAVEGLDEHIGAIKDSKTLVLLLATWIGNAGFKLEAAASPQPDTGET